jgi:hypothetical protein
MSPALPAHAEQCRHPVNPERRESFMSQRLFRALPLAAVMVFVTVGFDRLALAGPPPDCTTTENKVDKLLEACHTALVAGKYELANELAQMALDIDRDCVAAHPLVYKMHLLAQVKEHSPSAQSAESALSWWLFDEDDASAGREAETNPVEEGEDQALRPAVPAIDPKIQDALEKALKETTNPLAPKFIILEGEPAGGNELDDPVSHWPYVLSPLDFPSLFGEPEPAEPDAAAEDDDDAGEFEIPHDLNDLLREVIDAVREASFIDIDVNVSPGDGLRARCELQIGDVEFTLVWSDTGNRGVIVQLLPEAAPKPAHQGLIEWLWSR